MSNLKTAIIVLATALLTFTLTYKCNRTSPVPGIKTQIHKIDSGYKTNTTNYNRVNDSLVNELAASNSKMVASKQTLTKTQNKLLQMIKVTSIISPCDSVKATAGVYIAQVDSTLNHYAVKDSIQNGLIQIKDNQILMCDSAYTAMTTISNKLVKELNKSEKKARRRETLNKILGVGLGISLLVIGGSVILN
ncbi:MAG: hypothetical protein K0S53_380 [Bacteroidetes bacterium]|jgi:hypothetical protein|nr:hypothetical protein [Bacteroidota bacterium]